MLLAIEPETGMIEAKTVKTPNESAASSRSTTESTIFIIR